jgi:hypothetical protein
MKDIFADKPYGKAALAKIKNKDKNFKLYKVSWINTNTMKVTGAVFNNNKIVKDTIVEVYLSTEEIEQYG